MDDIQESRPLRVVRRLRTHGMMAPFMGFTRDLDHSIRRYARIHNRRILLRLGSLCVSLPKGTVPERFLVRSPEMLTRTFVASSFLELILLALGLAGAIALVTYGHLTADRSPWIGASLFGCTGTFLIGCLHVRVDGSPWASFDQCVVALVPDRIAFLVGEDFHVNETRYLLGIDAISAGAGEGIGIRPDGLIKLSGDGWIVVDQDLRPTGEPVLELLDEHLSKAKRDGLRPYVGIRKDGVYKVVEPERT